LFHTLFTKPEDFGRQLSSTIREAVLKPVTEGLGNMAANVLQPMIHGSDGSGGIAGAFKSIFGGKQDPVKLSTDQNTAATMQNSAVMAGLTAILAAAMGVSAPVTPSVNGAAGVAGLSIPAIVAPAVSAPMVPGASGMPFGMGLGNGFGTASITPLGWGAGAPAGWMGLESNLTGVPAGTSGFAAPVGGGAGGNVGDITSGFGWGEGAPPGWTGTSNTRGSGSGIGAGFGTALGALLRGGNGPIPGGAAGGWSTPPFVGNAPSGTAGGGILGNLKNLKNTNWGGFTRSPVETDEDTGETTGGNINGVNGVAGAALMTGGTMLAERGLLGNSRGTWTGVAEGTAGGTMIGMQVGGPLGAAIGAAVGFGVGVGELLAGVKSLPQTAHDDIKSLYGVDIPTNSGVIKQIVSMAQSQFGGSISMAVRSPSVRQLVMLYSEATGQKMPLSATTPRAGSLVEQGGALYQAPTFQNGTPYLLPSSLPTLANLPGMGVYPTPSGSPINLALHVDGQSTAAFMTGNYVTPQFVQDQAMAAQNSSYNRVQGSAILQQPGLVTG
jgi:hypothetical protein